MKKKKSSLRALFTDQEVMDRLNYIKKTYPTWGYRKIWEHLCDCEKMPVAQKRVYMLLKKLGFLQPLKTRRAVPKKNEVETILEKISHHQDKSNPSAVRLPAWGWLAW